jgi:hypothetical protein
MIFIIFASIFVYLIPTSRSKIAGVLYLIVLGFFIWGISGFIFSGQPSSNETYVFYAFYIFILGLHIPLLLKFSQIDHRKEHLSSARKILGSDVKHLSDQELHYRIKH